MHIVVTGGSGKLGGVVVEHLLAARPPGHQRRRSGPTPASAARFLRIDLTDYGQVVEALTGIDDAYDAVDAVVHLAAIPAPGLTANAATFENNVPVDVPRLPGRQARRASARSCGPPARPCSGCRSTSRRRTCRSTRRSHEPNSTYSLGKVVEETMAAQFCRWDPDLSMIGLRFSNVMRVEDYADFAGYTADQRRFNLWSYIDARDAAQAVELALAYEPHGMEVFVIASPDVVPHVPVEQLLRRPLRRGRAHPRARRVRVAAQHRQGPRPARLRPAAQLARRGLSRQRPPLRAPTREVGRSHGLRQTRHHRPRGLPPLPRAA